MYKKIKSLESLKRMGCNIFEYYVPENCAQLIWYAKQHQIFTIRFDSEDDSLDDLPFYKIDTYHKLTLMIIWAQSVTEHCKLILSDGASKDAIQSFNIVAKLERDGEFLAEASKEKVPLRHMYRYPLLTVRGNLNDDIKMWDFSEYYGLSRFDVQKVLKEIRRRNIYGKWCEMTYYPVRVGEKKEHTVYWQIRE